MYSRYAERQDGASSSEFQPQELGGFKESFSWWRAMEAGKLKFERRSTGFSGSHRIERGSASTATVAVPEAEEVGEMVQRLADRCVSVQRTRRQSVNTTVLPFGLPTCPPD